MHKGKGIPGFSRAAQGQEHEACQLGSGQRYMIYVTLFLQVVRVRKHTAMRELHAFHTRPCENCMSFACNSHMAVCFLTCSTCKNVWHNLIPRATAYCQLLQNTTRQDKEELASYHLTASRPKDQNCWLALPIKSTHEQISSLKYSEEQWPGRHCIPCTRFGDYMQPKVSGIKHIKTSEHYQ